MKSLMDVCFGPALGPEGVYPAAPVAPAACPAGPAAPNLGNHPGTEAILWYKHTCIFLCNVYPYTPLLPYFCYHFYFFGPLPPTNGAFFARPRMDWAVYEL